MTVQRAFNRTITLCGAVTVMLALAGNWTAKADSFPSRPLRIISPFSAGSPPDAFGRLVAQQLSGVLRQNVIVENHPGAGTTLGTKIGALAQPDGYTLLQVNSALTYGQMLYPGVTYDPIKSFAPVALLASWRHVLVGNPSVTANSLKELIAYARAHPGALSFASPAGAPPHLLAHMLRMQTGAQFNDITYRQAPQLLADLMAGRVQLYFSAGEPVVSMVKRGKLKTFASTGATREAALPNVPTMAEAGFADMTVDPSDWTGLVAPAGIPDDMMARLHGAVGTALKIPEVTAMLEKLGWTASSTDPNAFAKFISANVERWGKIVREAHLKKAD